MRDRQAGTTEKVSVSSDEVQADDDSGWLSISGDGRFVVFSSSAKNLVPGDANKPPYIADLFVRDRLAGTTEKVSVAIGGTQANGGSAHPSISADGRFVAFTSAADNLVPGDTNDMLDVFVSDRLAGTTERMSIGTNGEEANQETIEFDAPSISADGRHVAFKSLASNFVADDTNYYYDIFVRDRIGL